MSFVSTKTHDEMILDTVEWARSLSYGVVDHNVGMQAQLNLEQPYAR